MLKQSITSDLREERNSVPWRGGLSCALSVERQWRAKAVQAAVPEKQCSGAGGDHQSRYVMSVLSRSPPSRMQPAFLFWGQAFREGLVDGAHRRCARDEHRREVHRWPEGALLERGAQHGRRFKCLACVWPRNDQSWGHQV